jgi:hypothetical protein
MIWLLAACADHVVPELDATVLLGDPVKCSAEPTVGFDRFRRAGEERGLTHSIPDVREVIGSDEVRFGAGLAAGDIDGDGDIDLVAGRFIEPALVYVNDGTAHFSLGEAPPPIGGTYLGELVGIDSGMVMQVALVDLDGDRLPELLSAGFGFLAIHPNIGGAFGDPVLVHKEEEVLGIYLGMGIGDMDGDTDLDLVLISNVGVDLDCTSGDCEQMGWPDPLFENQGGLDFVLHDALESTPGTGSHAMLGVFTDRDMDGDADLFVPKDYWGDNAFWRNDGGVWTDDDEEIGADYTWSAMGIDAVDLNDDGWLDYCVTDTGPMRCLLSTGTDRYVEGSASLGLAPDDVSPNDTVGWSVMFSDLNNDGFWDAAYAGAPMGEQSKLKIEDVADRMFAGGPEGFTDVSAASGFDDHDDHYGMIEADFDGDGFLEIVLTGPGQPLRFYDNACNHNHWVELDLNGPGLNAEGWGAQIVVEAGGQRWMRELLPSSGPGHAPPRVHFGLGEIDWIDSIEVRWPGGASVTAQDLPVDRIITLSAG